MMAYLLLLLLAGAPAPVDFCLYTDFRGAWEDDARAAWREQLASWLGEKLGGRELAYAETETLPELERLPGRLEAVRALLNSPRLEEHAADLLNAANEALLVARSDLGGVAPAALAEVLKALAVGELLAGRAPRAEAWLAGSLALDPGQAEESFLFDLRARDLFRRVKARASDAGAPLKVKLAPAGAEVRVDGRRAQVAGGALPLASGVHLVTALAPGFHRWAALVDPADYRDTPLAITPRPMPAKTAFDKCLARLRAAARLQPRDLAELASYGRCPRLAWVRLERGRADWRFEASLVAPGQPPRGASITLPPAADLASRAREWFLGAPLWQP